jgi:putative FmdB family regulatory protein
MPTYAYKCKDCGHALEAQQAFSDPSLTECPVCGGRLRKQYGSVGVTFRGSGFYRTDSREPAKTGGSGTAEGAKTDGAAGAGTTEAKPAAPKTDAAPAKPAATPAASASS